MAPAPLASRSLEAAPVMDTPLFSRRPRFGLFGSKTSGASHDTTANTGLMDLAAMLEPDGGMPGDNPDVRAGRSIAAVFAFAAHGHTLTVGAFRLHVARLVGYLKPVSVGSDLESSLMKTALDSAATGKVPPGDWLALAREPGTTWEQIEETLRHPHDRPAR
jgi:hypothetical protein